MRIAHGQSVRSGGSGQRRGTAETLPGIGSPPGCRSGRSPPTTSASGSDSSRSSTSSCGNEPLFVPETESDVDKHLRQGLPVLRGDGPHPVHRLQRARPGPLRRLRQPPLAARPQDDAGFIGYFAAAPEASAEVGEMLEAAERWLAERGAKQGDRPLQRRRLPRRGHAHGRVRRGADVPLPLAAAPLPGAARGRGLPPHLSALALRHRLLVRALPGGLRRARSRTPAARSARSTRSAGTTSSRRCARSSTRPSATCGSSTS